MRGENGARLLETARSGECKTVHREKRGKPSTAKRLDTSIQWLEPSNSPAQPDTFAHDADPDLEGEPEHGANPTPDARSRTGRGSDLARPLR